MTDGNDYARELAICPECNTPFSKVGELLTTGKSMAFYACLECESEETLSTSRAGSKALAQSQGATESLAAVGLIWMGKAYKVTASGLVPVAHPDDVWG